MAVRAIAFRTVLLLLVMMEMALCQETWNGLRFGMSEQEAMTALGGKAERPKPGDRTGDPKTSETRLVYRTYPVGIYLFRAALNFRKPDGGLHNVLLSLEEPAGLPDLDSVTWGRIAIDAINETLTVKYGKPAVVKGKCAPENSEPCDCDKSWWSAGQRISLLWAWTGARLLVLTVSYRPIETGL